MLNIVITGHIDHGKSTLIGRLLLETRSLPDGKLKELKKISQDFGREAQIAYLADQLKEERERNITIETTHIFLKTRRRPYCLIDTPGHVEFIKNMLTGASHADCAVLLVDAQEGIREQTRRHAYLLRLLAIRHVIVLVNKMDLIDFSAEKFKAAATEISGLFQNLGATPPLIIPVAARDSENISCASPRMPWHRGPCLLKALDALPPPGTASPKTPLRFPIQDVYRTGGEDIIVGQIVSGTLRRGQNVKLLPVDITATIREIKCFGRKKTAAAATESIGLTLSSATRARRGQVIVPDPGAPQPVRRFQGNIFWLTQNPLCLNQVLTLRCTTQSIPCAVTQIEKRIDPATLTVLDENAAELQNNEAGIVHFNLHSPAVMENFQDMPELGRYTIENNDTLLGAGTVLKKF